jgi:signal transduction histidine kinase
MARWPARWLRRPGPLVWDCALAVALLAGAGVTVETGGGAQQLVHSTGPTIDVSTTPSRPTPGDPWNVRIAVHGGSARAGGALEPRLRIRNTRTGESTTYRATPAREPGVYRVRAVFPGAGVYSYAVAVGGFEHTVTIGAPADPPPRPAAAGTEAAWWDGPSAFALTLLATLPVAVRRRYPIGVLAVTLSAALALDIFFQSFYLPGALVALYTVAAHVGRPGSLRVAAVTAVALAGILLDDSGWNEEAFRQWEDAAGVATAYAVFGAAWLLGDNVRTRRAYLRALEERAARLEREREEDARRAAAQEQARIARELHDIIAHNVSVMTVQAGAAGDVFDAQPGRAREALRSIESTGRQALTELRRLLAVVRPDDGAAGFAPQPGLARLDALVAQVRSAGLAVELTVEGEPRRLPPGVDLSAYRIVQEALTNALKHADARTAWATVRYGHEALEIEVSDDGRCAAADDAGRGHGIIGMRERAALVGGEVHVGPAPGGGFGVRARIPLEEEREA